ncbi:putative cyclic AMP-dependent transcription factor ATF-6 alpha-like [Apostichopus japonicus]|uniref:Putative cyclic AMP-dependent transcription factor ATF-6 alpha-like n=1 Tax=Stichopus japonicus TaxID=307972 RepID=A0A2G8KRR2_STIJA|nr:putative cyclic AMP-dependent transcription factor ATF-6 alpha-like [Apostichopus japonicus]
MNGVPATIAVTQMSAAKAIVFSQSANGGCNLKTSCQGTVPMQQTVTVSAVRPSLSPQPPEDISDGKEMMAWKRQQRMIKNRESASLSRKKKKEYVQLLEQKMQDIAIENEMLKEENVGLKKRLCALEEEVESLRCLSPSSPSMSGKYVTCLLTVILFIGVNLSPFSLLTSNTRNDDFILTSSHHGRSLLSFEGDFENASAARSPPDMADIIKDQYYNETLLRLHDESSQHLMRLAEVEQALLIQKALNCSFLQEEPESTHSARLLDVLRKLAPNKEHLHEEDGNKKKEKEKKSKSNEKLKKVRKERRKKMMKARRQWQMGIGREVASDIRQLLHQTLRESHQLPGA